MTKTWCPIDKWAKVVSTPVSKQKGNSKPAQGTFQPFLLTHRITP